MRTVNVQDMLGIRFVLDMHILECENPQQPKETAKEPSQTRPVLRAT